MEHEWLHAITSSARECFRARRFMDDRITVYAKPPHFDAPLLLHDLETECYWPPLELEAGRQDTFLEKSFQLCDNEFRFWLNNDNIAGKRHACGGMRISTAMPASRRNGQCSWRACRRYKRWRAMGMRYA